MQDTSSNHKLIVVEGNIGAGKSTLLHLLRNKLNVNFIPEPTAKWQAIGDTDNLLDLFYKDTPRWAYTFQSYAFLTRVHAILENQSKADKKDVHILERSVYCDRFCFAKNCYESGLMTALEWNIYKEWFAWLVENFTPRPSGFIYLQTDPEIAHARIAKRKRSEESDISLAYLTSLHNKHEDWLIHKKESLDSLRNVPILTLNCNPDFQENDRELNQHIERINEFIDSLVSSGAYHTQPQSSLHHRCC